MNSIFTIINENVSPAKSIITHQYVDELNKMGSFKLLIAQGGYGTISKGIRAGIPILITPLFIGNSLQAQRINDYGNGIALFNGEQTADNFIESAKELLENKKYDLRAEQLKKEYADLGGSSRAADLILKHA
jgi:UDP:flavonoid glycosyltransferase YjiC (YdhE family)